MRIKGLFIPHKELQNLINGCLTMDRSCQKRIYEVYGPSMMSLCLRYTRSREEAEEVLQDGFLQMYKFIGQYKNNGAFEGWLRKIMINCSLQRYRMGNNRYSFISLSDDHRLLQADIDLTDNLNEKELIHLIQKLPPAYKMIFNLFVFEGLKHREIALLLNISEGTSKSNLSDARNILKKILIQRTKNNEINS